MVVNFHGIESEKKITWTEHPNKDFLAKKKSLGGTYLTESSFNKSKSIPSLPKWSSHTLGLEIFEDFEDPKGLEFQQVFGGSSSERYDWKNRDSSSSQTNTALYEVKNVS